MVGGDDAVARCPSNRNPRAPNPPANTLCDLFPRLIADLHSNSTAAGSGSTWLATGGNTIAESNMGCTGHFFSIRTEGYVPDKRPPLPVRASEPNTTPERGPWGTRPPDEGGPAEHCTKAICSERGSAYSG